MRSTVETFHQSTRSYPLQKFIGLYNLCTCNELKMVGKEDKIAFSYIDLLGSLETQVCWFFIKFSTLFKSL